MALIEGPRNQQVRRRDRVDVARTGATKENLRRALGAPLLPHLLLLTSYKVRGQST